VEKDTAVFVGLDVAKVHHAGHRTIRRVVSCGLTPVRIRLPIDYGFAMHMIYATSPETDGLRQQGSELPGRRDGSPDICSWMSSKV
jgi:hypothetical protein